MHVYVDHDLRAEALLCPAADEAGRPRVHVALAPNFPALGGDSITVSRGAMPVDAVHARLAVHMHGGEV